MRTERTNFFFHEISRRVTASRALERHLSGGRMRKLDALSTAEPEHRFAVTAVQLVFRYGCFILPRVPN